MAFIFLVFAVLLLAGCTGSDEFAVSVNVVDVENNPLEGAGVVFSPVSENGYSAILSTDEKGFAAGVAANGLYTITASKAGYFSDVLENQNLAVKKEFKFTLEKKVQ